MPSYPVFSQIDLFWHCEFIIEMPKRWCGAPEGSGISRPGKLQDTKGAHAGVCSTATGGQQETICGWSGSESLNEFDTF